MNKDYENILKIVNSFDAKTETQKEDRDFFLWCMNNFDDLLSSKNEQFHFTASCFIINQKHDKVLALYNNASDSWSNITAHLEGKKNLFNAILNEAKEQTAIKEFNILNAGEPISLEKILVDQHFKGSKLVYEHYHLNFTYLLEADETLPLVINTQENSDIMWMNFDEFIESVSSKNMVNIYKTILKKIN